MIHTRSAEKAFVEIDRGNYRAALENVETWRRSRSEGERLAAAAVLVYAHRADEAEAILDAVGPVVGALGRRSAVIAAEIALERGELDRARQAAAEVVREAQAFADAGALSLAWRVEVRAMVRGGDYTGALAAIEQPAALAVEFENEFALGVLEYLRGYALAKLSRYPAAGAALRTAVELLGRAEEFRWYGAARTFYGGYLTDVGHYDAALDELAAGEEIAREMGSFCDELWARNNAARVELIRGMYGEAVERLSEIVALSRFEGTSAVEQMALHLLGFGRGLLREWSEVARIGDDLRRLSELTHNPEAWVAGNLLVLWSRAAREDTEARRALEAWVVRLDARTVDVPWGDERDGYGSEHFEVEARLYLADAIAGRETLAALERLDEAARREHVLTASPLKQLADRVRVSVAGGAVRVHGRRLVVDLDRGYPDYDFTLRTVEWFLLKSAYDDEGRNGEAAGRRLGISRSRFHDRWRALHGEPTRPKKRRPAEKGN
jgi:tetratricopeptide (TPR) repeat protein